LKFVLVLATAGLHLRVLCSTSGDSFRYCSARADILGTGRHLAHCDRESLDRVLGVRISACDVRLCVRVWTRNVLVGCPLSGFILARSLARDTGGVSENLCRVGI